MVDSSALGRLSLLYYFKWKRRGVAPPYATPSPSSRCPNTPGQSQPLVRAQRPAPRALQPSTRGSIAGTRRRSCPCRRWRVRRGTLGAPARRQPQALPLAAEVRLCCAGGGSATVQERRAPRTDARSAPRCWHSRASPRPRNARRPRRLPHSRPAWPRWERARSAPLPRHRRAHRRPRGRSACTREARPPGGPGSRCDGGRRCRWQSRRSCRGTGGPRCRPRAPRGGARPRSRPAAGRHRCR
mmetsp:Transcript_18835/g.47653  ORF Transcript_18835/g.47653 Transcript_18835/m.47653 type:complete len:242 (+) Transcript_18835:119-844(+)